MPHPQLQLIPVSPARLVVGLTVCLLVLAATTTARAGCGDYVIIERPLLGPSLMPESTDQVVPTASMPQAQTPPRKPCDGPGCHRQPPLPSLPLPLPEPPSPHQYAALEQDDQDPQHDGSSTGWDQYRLRLWPGFARRIERPPRLV